MRRSVLILGMLLILASALPAAAASVSLEEARLVGERFLVNQLARDGAWAGASDARVLGCEPLVQDGRKLGYWLPVAPRGYIVVSLLRELPAVKAWSTECDLDPAAEAGLPALLKDAMAGTLDYLEKNYGDLEALPASVAPAENRESWIRLLSGDAPREERTIVGPLLSANWDQDGPFWGECPMGDGGLCLVGCVATSASMIMNYWDYPLAGQGSHSYVWGGDDSCGGSAGGGNLFANFADEYDWDNILNNYNSGYTPEQEAAVAELCYETAVAFEMDFGHCSSGAYVTDGATVYKDFFRYAPITTFIERRDYDQAAWVDLIVAELSQVPPRPIHYRIYAHSIVCDGYNDGSATFYYHMNYGWGGGQNQWYAIDNLFCNWAGCDYLEEGMVIGIEPLGYFAVTSPDAGTTWIHNETPAAVTWAPSDAATVFVDLYQDDVRIATVIAATDNDGSAVLDGPVDPAWGTGADYRLKVVDSDDHFGWSETFGIYGGGGWTDATGGAPLDDGGNGQGVAWADMDGDGDADLYVSNSLSADKLFSNDPGGFSDATAAPLGDTGYGRGAAWADLDNDGDPDLYLAKTSGGANVLYRNDGGGVFTDITAASPGLGSTSYSSDAAWGDYDGDGYADLYFANIFAADKLFKNNGDGTFSDVTVFPLGDGGWGRSAEWIDYDGDRDLDLYLVTNAANHLYRNNGNATFTEIYGAPMADSGDGYGSAWGDYDGDGDLDCYLVNNGANKLLRNDGGSFTDVTAAPLNDAGAGRGAAWADFDNDGMLDLYLANNGANHLYHNDGGAFSEATDPLLGDAGEANGVGWADYDGDGYLDLYLANNGANRLFHNDNAMGNRWLQLDLVGTTSNRLGIGAKVRLVAGGREQMRQVGGDAGYLSYSQPRVAFGLGAESVIDTLQVLWPSGILMQQFAVAVDQVLSITESATDVAGTAAPARVALLPNHPNPFNPRTELRFSLTGPAVVRLEVFDLGGRRVRTLIDGAIYGAGTHGITWQGRDDSGRALASGIYFARLSASGRVETRKLTLLK
ncbi:MAG: VCBS repeat-containing protein [Candidatus Krumholzibacteriota bacterium]|nr:VCBS repeat-containing protein [Candidatus Krumholzibacteriota bacterium]